MKKIMMIAAMMVATLSANAQNEVGQWSLQPKAGINIAKMTKFDYNKTRPGLIIGLEAEYGVAKNFGITAGLFYSMQGTKQEYNEETVIEDIKIHAGAKATYKLDYLNIPILAQYYLVKGLAIKAGIQPGFCVSKKYDYEVSTGIAGQTIISEQGKAKIEEGVKGFQFAIPVGLSYEYKNIVLDARYNIGVTKAFKNFDSHHSVFSITLGYKIPLN